MNKVNIEIFTHEEFRINKKKLLSVVKILLKNLGKKFESVEISFLKDEDVYKMNKNFLNHDALTDILTFPYSEKEPYSTEIIISFERAKENAKKYKVKYEEEILRLIAHGLLHTIGFNDFTRSEKLKMRREENKLLDSIKKENFIKH